MKRSYLFLSILSLTFVLLSCSKDKEQVTPESIDPSKLYNVEFSVGGFSESHRPFDKLATTKSTSSTQLINKILYVILDKDLLPIDTIMRDVHEKISTVVVKLPLGKYTLRTIGYNAKPEKGEVSLVYEKYKNVFVNFFPIEIDGFKSYNIEDVFVLNKELNVIKDTVYSDLELTRLNSRLELNIQDKIPNGIKHIELSISSKTNLYGAFVSGGVYDYITLPNYNQPQFNSSFIDVTNLTTLANQTLFTNVLTHEQRYTGFEERLSNVKINAYDTDGELVVTKEISDVKFVPNTITHLSGKLFEELGGEKNNSLAVTINEDYSSNIIKQQF